MVSTQRKEELEAAFKKGHAWGSTIRFLDSIDSVEEIEELAPLMINSHPELESVDNETISFYRENLSRWPTPKLEDWFKKEFPLVSARLDTPQKVRIFLRAVDARQKQGYSISVSTLASVFEDIIRKHEVDGQKVVRYAEYRGNPWRDALRIVYHTELQYWTVSKMLLPDKQSSGISGRNLFIDWRTKAEKEAVGETW